MSTHEEIQPLLAAYECSLLTAERRTEVEIHLMECDQCFEDLYEFSPVAGEIRRLRGRPAVLPARQRQTVRLLLAAALVAFAAAGIWIFRTETPNEDSVMRSPQAIRLLSPGSGQKVATPVLFRWEDPTNADEYLVSVFSGDGKLVHQMQVKDHEYRWIPEPVLAPGLYRWTVEARLSDGTPTVSSKASDFRLK